MTWDSLAFVATPPDVPLTLVPKWIKRLAVQVAWGDRLPIHPPSDDWLNAARQQGFEVYAWAWCEGIDVEAEARYHAQRAQGYAAFIANMEAPYDAHGNSGDPKYHYPGRYLEAFRAAGAFSGPLAITTQSVLGSDQTAWIQAGAVTMPQAFTGEHPSATLTNCVLGAQSWGWPIEQIRPLLQSYPTRPEPTTYAFEALQLGIGGSPYTVEQSMDAAGQEWLETMLPTIVRPQQMPTPPEPTPPPSNGGAPSAGTLIGSQHGIDAMFDRLIALDPGGSKPNRDPNNLSTWGAYDKARRALKILATDHDAAIRE